MFKGTTKVICLKAFYKKILKKFGVICKSCIYSFIVVSSALGSESVAAENVE